MRGSPSATSSFRVTCWLAASLPQEFHQFAQDFPQIQGHLLQLPVARFHLGHVQKIVDQVEQTLDFGMGPGEQFPLLIGQIPGQTVQDHGMLLLDGGQGGPEFMGHHAHEIVLHLIQFFEVGDVVKYGDRAQDLAVRPGKRGRQGLEVDVVLAELLGDEPLLTGVILPPTGTRWPRESRGCRHRPAKVRGGAAAPALPGVA